MRNFNLWGTVTMISIFISFLIGLYDGNVIAYVIFCIIGLISLVLTINSIENDK